MASEKVTDEPWHSVQQDVLLVLDPDDLVEPHAERLLGDETVSGGEHPARWTSSRTCAARSAARAAEARAREAAAATE